MAVIRIPWLRNRSTEYVRHTCPVVTQWIGPRRARRITLRDLEAQRAEIARQILANTPVVPVEEREEIPTQEISEQQTVHQDPENPVPTILPVFEDLMAKIKELLVDSTFSNHVEDRPSKLNRLAYAENWKKLMPFLVKYALSGKAQCNPSSCPRTLERGPKRLRVWLVDFSKFEEVEIETCRCERSAWVLLREGYFPASPRYPAFAFSLALLDIFDRTLGKGPISKGAFIHGITSHHENAKRRCLPNVLKPFHRTLAEWGEWRRRCDAQVDSGLDSGLEFPIFNRTGIAQLCPSCAYRPNQGWFILHIH